MLLVALLSLQSALRFKGRNRITAHTWEEKTAFGGRKHLHEHQYASKRRGNAYCSHFYFIEIMLVYLFIFVVVVVVLVSEHPSVKLGKGCMTSCAIVCMGSQWLFIARNCFGGHPAPL